MDVLSNALRRVRPGAAAAALVSAALVAVPVTAAEPQQQCNTTVGESASETVQSYLDRHPDIKRDLTDRAHADEPGSDNALLDYLGRHPDVRQALITLANNCTS